MDLRGHTAVVTGGASGIGRGMCFTFGDEGMNVVVADVEAEPAEAVASELRDRGVSAIAARCDVTQPAALEALADRAQAEFGAVNLLCNNAGVLLYRPLLEATEADWSWIFSVNVEGVLNGIRAFVPRMRAQQGPAHIVNTGSIVGLSAVMGDGARSGLGVYSASKYAVVAISETLREELAPEGIGVSVLCPGGVRTRIHDAARNRPAELGGPGAIPGVTTSAVQGIDPLEVGRLVADAVRANRPYIVTERTNRVRVEQRFANILEAFAFSI